MKISEFVAKHGPAAAQVAKETGISQAAILAQAGLESGWKDAPGNSFFGVTPGIAWKGPTIMLNTHEEVKGVMVPIKRPFRRYGSFLESARDWAALILKSSRYKAAAAAKGDPVAFLQGISRAGYATASKYETAVLGALRSLPAKLPGVAALGPLLFGALAVFF